MAAVTFIGPSMILVPAVTPGPFTVIPSTTASFTVLSATGTPKTHPLLVWLALFAITGVAELGIVRVVPEILHPVV